MPVPSVRGDDERLARQQRQDVGTVQDERVRRVHHLHLAVDQGAHAVRGVGQGGPGRLGGVGEGRPQLAELRARDGTGRVAETVEEFRDAAGPVEEVVQGRPYAEREEEAFVQAVRAGS
nr:hypothetical protein [Actinomadura sp. J1-007]